MTDREQRIRNILTERFTPSALEVKDDSGLHAGHAGARPEGQTHFSVRIVSDAFAGLNRVARHRLVNAALAGEFEMGLHALAVDARAPEEA